MVNAATVDAIGVAGPSTSSAPPPPAAEPESKYGAFNIDYLETDDETDEDDDPRHEVPAWAEGKIICDH